jgi:MarR family 2-MHQ and catechol resistance regulon transcriptional repressor
VDRLEGHERVTRASPPGIHVWLVLMKAHRSVARHAQRSVEQFGLGMSDFAILELLLHKGPQNVVAIGRTVSLTSGAITTAIDRLEAQGKLERGAHPTDRRSRVVRLTAEGREEIERVFAAHTAAMSRAARALSGAEKAALVSLLKKLGTTADAAFDVQRE